METLQCPIFKSCQCLKKSNYKSTFTCFNLVPSITGKHIYFECHFRTTSILWHYNDKNETCTDRSLRMEPHCAAAPKAWLLFTIFLKRPKWCVDFICLGCSGWLIMCVGLTPATGLTYGHWSVWWSGASCQRWASIFIKAARPTISLSVLAQGWVWKTWHDGYKSIHMLDIRRRWWVLRSRSLWYKVWIYAASRDSRHNQNIFFRNTRTKKTNH